MAWLLRNGQVLASCTYVDAVPLARIPIDPFVGAQLICAKPILFTRASGADIAVLDEDHRVKDLASYRGYRPIARRRSAMTMLIVAERGAFLRWGLLDGDRIEIRP